MSKVLVLNAASAGNSKQQRVVPNIVVHMHARVPQGKVEALQRQHAQAAILEAALASSKTQVQREKERIAALGKLQKAGRYLCCGHSLAGGLVIHIVHGSFFGISHLNTLAFDTGLVAAQCLCHHDLHELQKDCWPASRMTWSISKQSRSSNSPKQPACNQQWPLYNALWTLLPMITCTLKSSYPLQVLPLRG